MDELPRIDPSWTRRRQRPQQEDSVWGVILASTVGLCALAWAARAHLETESALRTAAAQAKAHAAVAHARLMDRVEAERNPVHYLSQAEADRQLAEATGSSIGHKAIHRCAYGYSANYQTGPCRAPWVDAPPVRGSSRWDNAAEQARMRAEAEARLRAEEIRFAQLTGQGVAPSLAYSAEPVVSERQRCALAKADRDRAYQLVGNNRTYDFIRHWDDVVYEACKNT